MRHSWILVAVAIGLVLGSCSSSGTTNGARTKTEKAGPLFTQAGSAPTAGRPIAGGVELDRATVSVDASGLHARIVATRAVRIEGIKDYGTPSVGPEWFVRIWSGGDGTKPKYFIILLAQPGTAGQIPKTSSYFCVDAEGCDKVVDFVRASFDGLTISIDVPGSAVPAVTQPFTWVVSSFWNETTDQTQGIVDSVPKMPPKDFENPPTSERASIR